MPDVVGALNRKKMRLLAEKRELTSEYERRKAELETEIKRVDAALSIVNDAVKEFLCKTCQGTGTVRKMDAAGQMEDVDCPDCKGTGVALREEGEKGHDQPKKWYTVSGSF